MLVKKEEIPVTKMDTYTSFFRDYHFTNKRPLPNFSKLNIG